MAGDSPALAGLLIFLVIAATPTLVLWASLRLLPAVFSRVADRRRARHRPAGPPLESVLADLRRLRREVRAREHRTNVRRTAVLAAYDDVLIDVCRRVDVDAPLATAVGHDRVYARLLTEAALEDAGIALDPPPGARRPDVGGQQ